MTGARGDDSGVDRGRGIVVMVVVAVVVVVMVLFLELLPSFSSLLLSRTPSPRLLLMPSGGWVVVMVGRGRARRKAEETEQYCQGHPRIVNVSSAFVGAPCKTLFHLLQAGFGARFLCLQEVVFETPDPPQRVAGRSSSPITQHSSCAQFPLPP